MWHVGTGRGDLSVYEPGIGMFGWAQPRNVVLGVATPLSVRAIAVRDEDDHHFVIACCDLCAISESLRAAVLARVEHLGIGEHELMLTATHNHSGPSGYSAYLYYALSAPGVSRHVHDGLAGSIACAIEHAVLRLSPARAFLRTERMPLAEPVAFNRALAAHNSNRGVVPAERPEEAVRRTHTVVRFEREDGSPLALLSFFPVHCTSVHSDFQWLHPDNKGEAALYCEARVRDPEFVAVFAQESAGDVSPSFRFDRARGWNVGTFDDDLESARDNGARQARHALELFERARHEGTELSAGALSSGVRYHDFAGLAVHPDFADSRRGVSTGEPVLGLGFGLGTREGPGPLAPLAPLCTMLSRRQARRHSGDSKVPFQDLGRGRGGRVLGLLGADTRLWSLVPDRRARYYREAIETKAGDAPWVPRHLPAQVVELGALVIAALPIEPTTTSGDRIEAAVREGIDRPAHVVVCGYSNAYVSYLTTAEEYAHQGFEGAATLYGPNSLGAWCTVLRSLARDVARGGAQAELGRRGVPLPLRTLPEFDRRWRGR